MPYPINQRAHQFNSIQSVPVSFGLWDTALKFLSPSPRSDVTDHLVYVKAPFETLVKVYERVRKFVISVRKMTLKDDGGDREKKLPGLVICLNGGASSRSKTGLYWHFLS